MKHWKQGDILQEGKYTIESLLGCGGFGITYKANKHSINGECELVAIKTLNPNMQVDVDFSYHQEKFVREAFLLKGFEHPNIIKVKDIFLMENLWCMEMEYIQGPTLFQYVEDYYEKYNQNLSEAEALKYIKEIGEALNFLHYKGYLHRDVKPANIMLREPLKEAILIDFGIARQFVQDKSEFHTNSLTQGYAPLEQYDKYGKRGAYTDVYALAATLYYSLTRAKIVPSVFRKKGEKLCPRDDNPKISSEVNEAIMWGMELYPENRPQTMEEWLSLIFPEMSKSNLESNPDVKNPVFHTHIVLPSKPTVALSKNQNLTEFFNKHLTQNLNKTLITRISQITQLAKNNKLSSISRRKFLKWGGLGGGGLIATLAIGNFLKKYYSQPSDILVLPTPTSTITSPPTLTPTPTPKPQMSFETSTFQTIEVNDQGDIINTKNKEAKCIIYHLGNGVNLEFVYIPAGKFLMGSPKDEKDRDRDEEPQHWVDVPAFLIGKYPVTQAQWHGVMGENPSHFKGFNRPVENVSWVDCVKFCRKVSQSMAVKCRLPSEAEWEYACRAGTTTPFYFGETITSDLANYDAQYLYREEAKGIYRKETTQVGIFPPNAFGLYDMHGNVWEWCADRWHDNYEGAPTDGSAWVDASENNHLLFYVVRGGSWFGRPRHCRSALRYGSNRDNVGYVRGFRVASALPDIELPEELEELKE